MIPPDDPYGTLNKMLKAEVGIDEQAIDRAIRKAELATHGGDRKSPEFQVDNVKLNAGQGGNSETYTLRRLRRDRPDLADRVEHGKLSANKAAIEAGFRHPTLTIRGDDPEHAARILRNHYKDPEQLKLLAKYLLEASE